MFKLNSLRLNIANGTFKSPTECLVSRLVASPHQLIIPSKRFYVSLSSTNDTKMVNNNNNTINNTSFHSRLQSQRLFYTSSVLQSYYRPPKNRIVKPSILNELLDKIPDSLKIIFGISAFSSLFIFIALPLLTIVLPPIVLGSFITYKVIQRRSRKQMEERWKGLKESKLIFVPKKANLGFLLSQQEIPLEQINDELANFEIQRLHDAFMFDEDGISEHFEITDVNTLALGTIDGIQFDWQSTKKNINGFIHDLEELLTVQSRPLYDKNTGDKIATVVLSLKNADKSIFENIIDQNVNRTNTTEIICLIEVIPLSYTASKKFVINTPSIDGNSGEFIEIKGKTRTL